MADELIVALAGAADPADIGLDMPGAEMPTLQPGILRVLYRHDEEQPSDLTTKDDVAAFTAAAAADDDAPRILRIAGDSVGARGIAELASQVSGQTYKPLRVGGLRSFGPAIRLARLLAPQPTGALPARQYMRDRFSGLVALAPLDDDRYPGVGWTSVRDHLGRLPTLAAAGGFVTSAETRRPGRRFRPTRSRPCRPAPCPG